MGDRIIVILLIAAILLSALSVVLTLSFDATTQVSTRTIIKENDVTSANVGLVVLGTPANKNG